VQPFLPEPSGMTSWDHSPPRVCDEAVEPAPCRHGLKKHCGPITETEIPTAMQVRKFEGYRWLSVVSLWGFGSYWWPTASPSLITN